MSLRSRITLPILLQDLELAAESRYFEGLELAARGYGGGAIYLLGYVGEMLLKYACLRSMGYQLQDDVRACFEPVRLWVRHHGVTASEESSHSIEYWHAALTVERQFQKQPLPPGLQPHAARLHSHWRVELRYLPDISNPSDVLEVIEDVSWIRTHYHEFWR